jgi:hypothetical protein
MVPKVSSLVKKCFVLSSVSQRRRQAEGCTACVVTEGVVG